VIRFALLVPVIILAVIGFFALLDSVALVPLYMGVVK
jgi:hypothetical protein